LNYRHKIQYLLVQKLKISNQAAKDFLSQNKVLLNGEVCSENRLVQPYDSLEVNGISVQNKDQFEYYILNKPKGVECTFNTSIENNLSTFLGEEYSHLFYAGRLDKNSEGLLLLMNDGFAYNKIISPNQHLPKKYVVKLEKRFEPNFIESMSKGVKILGTTTLPCLVSSLNEQSFEIILTQGMNRQIRRMCFALDNYVTQLRRTSIGAIELGKLPIGQIRKLNPEEILWIQNLT
jgi:23S rRNA pseudouridine2604 synthase